MRKQKDELIVLTPSQQNPFEADPHDFEVGRADEFSAAYVPGHGQCGRDEKEYDALLDEAAQHHGKSKFQPKGEEHPNVDRAGSPHSDGF